MPKITADSRERTALIIVALFLLLAALVSLGIWMARNSAQDILDNADSSISSTQTSTYSKKTIALIKGYDSLPSDSKAVVLSWVTATCGGAKAVTGADVNGIDSKRYIDMQLTCTDSTKSGRLILAKSNNQWVKAYSGTTAPNCQDTAQYKLPSSIVPTCENGSGQQVPNTQS